MDESVVLDTSVASLLVPGIRKAQTIEPYRPHMTGRNLVLSFQSVAELLAWAEYNNWGTARRAALETFLAQFTVIPYDMGLARVWARVMANAQTKGRRLESGDAWVAAMAIHYGLPLLTEDKDFTELSLEGLTVIRYTQS